MRVRERARKEKGGERPSFLVNESKKNNFSHFFFSPSFFFSLLLTNALNDARSPSLTSSRVSLLRRRVLRS